MAQTFSAKQTARIIAAKTGRPCDAKRVRAWVRDNVAAYDDDGYTSHQYDARLRDRIVAAFVQRAKGTTPGTPARSRAASEGRGTRTTSKRASKPPTRAMGSGPTPRAAKPAQDAPSAPSAPESAS